MMGGRFLIVLLFIGAALAAAPFLASNSDDHLIIHRLPPGALQQIVAGIYHADSTGTGSYKKIQGVIVPHHLTASTGIARGIKALAGSDPEKIVLLSPDHFDRCPTLFCTTNGVLVSEFGSVKVNDSVFDFANSSPLVTATSDLFEQEHGIGAVIPFIAHYIPDAEIVPIVLSQRAWKNSAEELLALLEGMKDRGFVLIVSSDFSHYLSLSEADKKDALTKDVLLSGNLDDIARLDNPQQSDCPGCLWLLASLLQKNGSYYPEILLHTNSARLLDDERIIETTSHFTVLFEE